MVLAGLMAVSCQDDKEEAVFSSTSAVAPELAAIQGGLELSVDGEALSWAFTKADYKVTAPVQYTLYFLPGDDAKIEVKSKLNDDETALVVTQKDLNSAFVIADIAANEPYEATFQLVSALCNDKTSPVAGTELFSNKVTASFIPYDAAKLDVDAYPHVWIIGAGASVGGWSFETIEQYLYDYEGKGTYTGLIDYCYDAAKGWKLTGVAGWDDNCNWGLDGAAPAPDAEASSLSLISDGGSSDIKVYSKRFYMWSFDKSGLKLSKQYSFDNLGVVGSLNGWNQADPAMKMKYNATTHKFFLDLNIPEGTEMKFTCDDSWNLNFGVGCAQGGDNIVPDVTGNVRVYLDLNKNEYEFNATMFGKDEVGTVYELGEKQEYPSAMYMIGQFCGWDWDFAFEMAKVNGSTAKFWTIAYLKAGEGFKFCDTKAWGGDFCTLDTNNGFSVSEGNCLVEADGVYAVAVDWENKTVNVEPAQIKGIGDAFLGWDEPVVFTIEGSTAYAVTQTGNLRMFCDVTYYATDWWRMEFNIYDGKIVFRGDGGDQPSVPVTDGQKVRLDLTNLTGTIE